MSGRADAFVQDAADLLLLGLQIAQEAPARRLQSRSCGGPQVRARTVFVEELGFRETLPAKLPECLPATAKMGAPEVFCS